MLVLGAKSRPLLTIALVCCLCVLSLMPSIECLFKLVKKKKFMEGFLVGFLVGNEYALHKSPGKSDMHGMPPQMAGMDYRSMSHNYLDQHDGHPYMPKKSDRSYRVKPGRFLKHRSKKGRIKKMLKFPVYIRKQRRVKQ